MDQILQVGAGLSNTSQMTPEFSLLLALYPLIQVTVTGMVMSVFYFCYNWLYTKIRRQILCSITVQSSDDVYKMLLNFLMAQGYLKGSMTNMKCQLKPKKNTWWWNASSREEGKKPEVEYLPAPGDHIFVFKGKKMWAQQREGEVLQTGYERKPTKQEALAIMCYGKDTTPLKELIAVAIDFSQEQDSSLTNIYQVHRWGSGWEKCQQKRPRTLESVVLDSNVADRIIADINTFMTSGEWYITKGVPYRRGYLLYGPPGTGKTSFVQAIAAKVGLNICYLNLSGGNMDDDGLNNLLNSAPQRSIILLEDIDAIFVERTSLAQGGGDFPGQSQCGVTFSGLLNALDGVKSQEGRILIMTTNHREKLDPALMRPGRADVHVELNWASEIQMKRLFLKFFPEESDERAQEFANQLPEFKLNMAKLQGHFLKHRADPQGAIDHAKSLLDVEYQIKDMSINEWLRRLNMHQYAPKFRKEGGVKRVCDLKYINEGDLTVYGMEAMTDRKRVMDMINGIEDAKMLFALQTRSQARTIISNFLSNGQDIEEVLDLVGEEHITGFQLRDIFDENKNFNIIKKKIQHKIAENNLIKTGLAKEKEDDKDDEKDKPKTVPKDDIEQMLKSIGLHECLPKLKEKEINEPEVFFELGADTLVGLLDIKTEGKKYKFKKKMEEIMKKHEKAQSKKEQEEMSEVIDDAFKALQKQTSIKF